MTFKILLIVLCASVYAEVQVPKLKLNDGHDIPAIALGTWLGLDNKLNRVDPKSNEVELAVKWALEAGYKHIDTAAIYQIEDQVGQGLAGHPRDDVFVTTKLWNSNHETQDVVPALQESLKKLQLEYVDLYLIHWPIPQYAPPPRVDDPALRALALKYNKTVPQIVLRYLVELGVIPLPKSLTKSRIEANIDVFDFSLTEDERNILKNFDKHYRTLPQYKWLDHPEYPFEKNIA